MYIATLNHLCKKNSTLKDRNTKRLLSNIDDNGDNNEKKKMFKNMGGNVQGGNFLGGSFPDTDISDTSKSLFVKSLLPSILNNYI